MLLVYNLHAAAFVSVFLYEQHGFFYLFKTPFLGYLEMFYSNQWGFVCDAGSWTMEEANLVCKQLGFSRGVRSTTQGLVHGPVDESRKITEKVDCQGTEDSLEKCIIRYLSIV